MTGVRVFVNVERKCNGSSNLIGLGSNNSWKGKFFPIIRVFVGIGLFYYVVTLTKGWGILEKLASSPWVVLGVLLLPFFGAAIESKRMCILFLPHKIPISFHYGFQLVAISALFNFCIPGGTGGDLVKGYYLVSENKKKGIEVATVILADRVIALFSFLLLIIFLALINFNIILDYPVVGGLSILSGVGAILLILGTMISWSVQFRESRIFLYVINHFPLGKFFGRMSDAIYVFRFQKSALLFAGGYSLMGHITLAGMFYLIGPIFFNFELGLVTCLVALLGMLANALPITPGGLGVGEAAFEGLFRGLGYGGGAYLILAWRIGMIPICILGAIFYMRGVNPQFQDFRKSIFPIS